MRDIEISKVLSLSKDKKYEIACACFDVVDHILKVDIPRSLKGRKRSVQAMSLIADENLKFGYEKSRKPVVIASEEE